MGIRDLIKAFVPGRGVLPDGASTQPLDHEVARLNAQQNRADVQFGPGDAPPAAPLDASGRPRTWPYRVGWNIPSQPGEGRPLPYQTLRDLARTYDLAYKCITIRADEVCALRFDIVAREADRRRARQVIQEQQEKIAAIRRFFAHPCPGYTWQSWLRKVLEDHFILDAVALYKWRTYGGQLYGLRPLDGATIKPLITVQGDIPQPPLAAYQQYLYGVARDSFTTDELIYAVKNRRNDSPYGFSAVEQFMWHVNLALRFDRATLDYFTDGTLPEGVAIAPPQTSAQQLQELRQWWDGVMAGDTRALHKLQWVPAGTQFHLFKPWQFDEGFARWLVSVTCAAFDVMPQELGFEPRHGGLGGKGFAEETSAVQQRKSIEPLARWLCEEILDPVIAGDFEAPELEAKLITEGDEEDQLAAAQARNLDVRSGARSLDEIVEEMGGTPPGIGRMLVLGNTVLFEPDLIRGTKDGAASVAGVVMDSPGVTEKPPAAPKPGTPGSNAVAPGGSSTQQGAGSADDSGADAAKAAELQRFLRFAGARQKAGRWRDFESAVLDQGELNRLNKAASSGASAEELRRLVQPEGVVESLDDQPEAFRRRAEAMHAGYQHYTAELAQAVARALAGVER